MLPKYKIKLYMTIRTLKVRSLPFLQSILIFSYIPFTRFATMNFLKKWTNYDKIWYISLVLILHRYEQAFLTSVIGFNPAKYFWIGLSDAEEQGMFRWASGDPVTFTHWNAGMPGTCYRGHRVSALGAWEMRVWKLNSGFETLLAWSGKNDIATFHLR